MRLATTPSQTSACPYGTRPRRQRGYATLGIGVVLLLMLTLMTIYLSKSGIMDLRSSADKARYAEALAAAEARVDTGVAWMSVDANRKSLTPSTWALCNDGSITSALPGAVTASAWQTAYGSDSDGDGSVDWRCQCRLASAAGAVTTCGTDTVYMATPSTSPGSVYFVVAGGQSADGSANVAVKQGLYLVNSIFPGASNGPPPLMGAGNVPLNGNFTVVANPNAGGQGVPVSIWSKIEIDAPQGSSASCGAEEYVGGNCTTTMSKKDVKGIDIVDNDTTYFPPDMFAYVFGVSSANYTLVKSQATPVTDCGSLNAASTGVLWAASDCTIPSNTTVGSVDHPVVLVVESSNFKMNANSTLYGAIFAFDPNGNAGEMTMNGGATLYGTILSNDTVEMGININGTFNLIYDVTTMTAILDPGENFFKMIARLPGSWADYL